MARHRHAINVRADGLSVVLGPLAHDPAVRAALLVDIDSGMVLGATGGPGVPGPEELGAVHGELMRLACGADGGLAGDARGLDCELAVSRGSGHHVVARRVADPHGDRLALTVLVEGPPRALRRVRRRLGEVSTAALTAGPTVSLRPRDGVWVPGAVEERPVLRAPVTAPVAGPGRPSYAADVPGPAAGSPPGRPAGGPEVARAGTPAGPPGGSPVAPPAPTGRPRADSALAVLDSGRVAPPPAADAPLTPLPRLPVGSPPLAPPTPTRANAHPPNPDLPAPRQAPAPPGRLRAEPPGSDRPLPAPRPPAPPSALPPGPTGS